MKRSLTTDEIKAFYSANRSAIIDAHQWRAFGSVSWCSRCGALKDEHGESRMHSLIDMSCANTVFLAAGIERDISSSQLFWIDTPNLA